MTEQQMPARIWAISNFGVELWSKEKMPIYDSQQYVRSDLAERMADALERTRVDLQASKIVIESYKNASAYGIIQTLEIVAAALSAFKTSTQDTEARHDDL